MPRSAHGTKRRYAGAQQLGRFLTRADIGRFYALRGEFLRDALVKKPWRYSRGFSAEEKP
jgi:hypothetical protein